MSLSVGLWKSKNQVPTQSDINEVERILSIQLPASYIDLMKKWNGGYFPDEYQIVLKDNMPKELDYYLGSGFWSLSMLSGISSDIKNNQGIVLYGKERTRGGNSLDDELVQNAARQLENTDANGLRALEDLRSEQQVFGRNLSDAEIYPAFSRARHTSVKTAPYWSEPKTATSGPPMRITRTPANTLSSRPVS